MLNGNTEVLNKTIEELKSLFEKLKTLFVNIAVKKPRVMDTPIIALTVYTAVTWTIIPAIERILAVDLWSQWD